MGIFSMFSGRKERLALMAAQYQQMVMQQQLMAQEDARAAEAKRQFEAQQKQMDDQIAATTAETKTATTDDTIARLGGLTGYRSLLSGRRGGGGYGPRSMLDAA